MKTLSSITVFLCSSSRRRLFAGTTLSPEAHTLVGIHRFSTSSHDSSASSSYHSSSRRNSDDVRNVRVSVWWDFENCQLPCNANAFKVTQFITSAVRSAGIKGPIQITAFGDVLQLSRSNQEALSSTGVNLTHIPNGGKNSADRSLLVDLMYWVSQNPPPAHLFLISGDRDFAGSLHRLRMSNYNILLASTDNAPAVLCSAASIMWQWSSLVKGENLIGKHFNQPPDGPYASWYGSYRVPLEDPFAVCSSEEASDSNSEAKIRPIPKGVVSVIRNILNIHPKGLSITELRSELGKSNVTIEKDLYGHKKFSRFLLAMPNLVRLKFAKDGQYIIHGVSQSHETCVPTPEKATDPSMTAKDSVPVVASKDDGVHNTSVPPRGDKTPISSKLNEPNLSTDSQALPEKKEDFQHVQQKSTVLEKEKEAEVSSGQLYPVEMKRPTPEVGIFKSLWRKWFRGNNDHQEKVSHATNKASPTQKSTDTVSANVSKDRTSDPGKLSLPSLSINEVIQDKPSKPDGIFTKIVSWCKVWKSNDNSDNPDAESNKGDKEITSDSKMQEIFTESFWNDMLVFLNTSQGSASILESKTRLEMVQNLQRLGPSRLQSLSESNMLHLVDLLISEKKWVAESPSRSFPFRLVGPIKSKESTKKRKELKESDDNSQASPKNRDQIMADCQNLVNEVLKECPNGFNISCFKKLFLDKYGYHLEVQQLGYQKLASLLQIMPRVKLESNYILPSEDFSRGFLSEIVGPVITDYSKSDLSRTEENNDTQWEELGPISKTGMKKDDDKINHEFERVSDNNMSDSEEENSLERSQNKTKDGTVGESSLLQILDSWYGNSRLSSGSSDTDSDHSNDDKNKSFLSGEQRLKPSKRYTFVADKPKDNNEDTINGILGRPKKSKLEG